MIRRPDYGALSQATLGLPYVSQEERQAKRVGRRILGLTPATVYRGLRLGIWHGAGGTVTNFDERFVDVDWDGGGWTRYEWENPAVHKLLTEIEP